MSGSNAFLRFFGAIWRGMDGLRKVLHLLLLLLVFLVFFGALSGEAPQLMPQRAALFLQPVGPLVEQVAGDPYDRVVRASRESRLAPVLAQLLPLAIAQGLWGDL